MNIDDSDGTGGDAARVSGHLEAIRRVIRESIWAEARRFPIPLTPQQVLALQILVDHGRDAGSGLSLSDLSQRMGLAHSTVSGIVTRLEARGLLQRTADPEDRRFVRVELTEPVRDWVQRDLPTLRLGPLARAISKATADERARVLDGLAILERLLADTEQPGA